jgi:site-specific DNA-cytosine methylase
MEMEESRGKKTLWGRGRGYSVQIVYNSHRFGIPQLSRRFFLISARVGKGERKKNNFLVMKGGMRKKPTSR